MLSALMSNISMLDTYSSLLDAIAIIGYHRLEAIVEVIAFRLEAIAFRLEAVAVVLENPNNISHIFHSHDEFHTFARASRGRLPTAGSVP